MTFKERRGLQRVSPSAGRETNRGPGDVDDGDRGDVDDDGGRGDEDDGDRGDVDDHGDRGQS